MRLQFSLEEQILSKRDEIIRNISFISEHIKEISLQEKELTIELNEAADPDLMKQKIQKMLDTIKKSPDDEVIFENAPNREFIAAENIWASDTVKSFGNGLIRLNHDALALFNQLDQLFRNIALQLGGKEVQYPVLLPVDALRKTGYLKSSPQYNMFICSLKEDLDVLMTADRQTNEDLSKQHLTFANLTTSPAACFHCYMDLEHQHLEQSSIYTFMQNVFRNEGRNSWGQYGRLRDYHVREIVFFGNPDFVLEHRENVMEQMKQLILDWNLHARICVTSDPFVVPTMQKYKSLQMNDKIKYELQLGVADNKYISVASFNFHNKSFTNPFQIRVQQVEEDTVSGCIGFGLERWVLALIAQFGVDPTNWPTANKELAEVNGG